MERELIIDGFAGGGGASSGIERALGISPDIAINHNAHALACHAANHPNTLHVCEDVWHARLKELVAGRPVGLLWLSPDCKHFSRAKGSVPVSKEIRSLAWIAVRWASQVKPRVIILENVREFADWGPVVPRWECKKCEWKGTEGQALLQRSRRRCPSCESLCLKQTSDFMPDPDKKAMTFRLFCNRLRGLGYDVRWKNLDAADYGTATHRRRLFLIARCDGKPIVWPETTHIAPKKVASMPLFDRIEPYRTAAECINFDLPCPSIFDRAKPLAEKTLKRIAMGIKRYVLEAAEPFLVPVTHNGERRSHPTSEPMPTITSAHRGEFAVVSPTLIEAAYGADGRWGDGTKDIQQPLGTIHAGGKNHALVSAFLVKHFGGVVGVPIDTPLPTVTTRGTQTQLAAVCLSRFDNGRKAWNAVNESLGTITSQGQKFGLVFAFLVKYFGTAIGQPLTEPLHTITGKHRFGLVQVEIGHGQSEPAVAMEIPGAGMFVIADIGMRMLKPRELALAQGFKPDYILPPTTTRAVAMIGNSVCPPVAEAIVKANYQPREVVYKSTTERGIAC